MDLKAQQNRLRIVLTLRFTALCVAILVTAALVGVSTGIAMLIPAMFLVLFLKDETLAASLALLVGTLFGVAMVLLISLFWSQDPFVFLLVSLLVVFALSYWAAQGIRGRWRHVAFPVGGLLCLLSALFTEITGTTDGIDAAFIWLEEIPLGVLVFWILLIGLWPSPSAHDFDRLILAARRECAELLRQTIDPVAAGRHNTFIPSRVGPRFFADTTRSLNLNAGRLRTPPLTREFLSARIESLSRIHANIRYIQRSFAGLPGPGLNTQTRDAVTQLISALADRTENNSSADMEAAFEAVQREGRSYASEAGDNPTARRLAARIAGFVVAAKALETDIATFYDPIIPQSVVSAPTQEAATPLMIDSLQTAAKIVIGVLIGLLVFMATNLPANAFLVIIILIVLVQPNLGRAHLRFRLWFPGVAFGTVWALLGLMVLSLLPYFVIYLVWLMPALFLAGYIGLGPDRVSYVGIQIVAAMMTIMGMAVFPASNVLSADARIVGAVVGFLIALSVDHFIWPLHPATLLRKNMVGNLKTVAQVLSHVCRIEAEPRNAEAEAQLARELTALKLQIQADFGLLYDLSYMIASNARPAYDYQTLAHQLGLMHAQVWCLHEALSDIDDVNSRRAIVAPLTAVEERLSGIFTQLATQLDEGAGASAQDVSASIRAVREQVRPFVDQIASASPADQQEAEYGINAVGMLLFHLDRFADAMDTSRAQHVVRTDELAHLYEATDR